MSQKLFVDKMTVLLRHYREASGKSQSELADAVKIGLRSYQRYESGESVPSIDLIYLISKELNFELKEMFSPEDMRTELPHMKIFDENNLHLFTDDSDIINCKLLEIYESPEFKNVLETGDFKSLREYAPFYQSPYKLVVSTPKQSLVNLATQKAGGFHSDVVPTMIGHDDARKLGITWAIFMDKKQAFFSDNTEPVIPKGKCKMKVKGIFTNHNRNYVTLAFSEIEIIKNM